MVGVSAVGVTVVVYARGNCRCLCYCRNSAEVGIMPFRECPFGKNTWCLFIQKFVCFGFEYNTLIYNNIEVFIISEHQFVKLSFEYFISM